MKATLVSEIISYDIFFSLIGTISADTTYNMRFGVKRVQRDGEEYFQIDKMSLKSRVGDGVIKLTAKDPEYQFAGVYNVVFDHIFTTWPEFLHFY